MPVLKTDDPDITALEGIHLYHALPSNASQRVRWLLDEKNLEWQSRVIDLMGKKENLEDWYLKINPKGLVPAMVDNGVPVTESTDILYYIEEKYPEPSFFPKDDATLAASVREWVDLAGEIHLTVIKPYVYGTKGLKTKTESDMERYRKVQKDKELLEFHEKAIQGFTEEDVKKAKEKIMDILGRLEDRLKDHEYLVGETFTIADMTWVSQYLLFKNVGIDLAPYPGITAWSQRSCSRPGFKKEAKLMAQMKEKMKGKPIGM